MQNAEYGKNSNGRICCGEVRKMPGGYNFETIKDFQMKFSWLDITES